MPQPKVQKESFKITNGTATVWAIDEEPNSFYLTTERGSHRGVAKLESENLKDAVAEAHEVLK